MIGVNAMTRWLAASAGVAMLPMLVASAAAQQPRMMEQEMADLSAPSADQVVTSLRYCNGIFHVTNGAGESLDFPEFNLRFKVDGSEKGPPAGTPALLSAGMMGDRAFVIFADPAEISASIAQEC